MSRKLLRLGGLAVRSVGRVRVRHRRVATVSLALAVLTIVFVTMPRIARAALLPGTCARPNDGSRELVLQTFNVWGLPWPAGRDVTARCAELAMSLLRSRADIVALQEVWDDDARQPLLATGWNACYCESPQGLLGQNGLLTLSRQPIVAATSHCFVAAAGIEFLVGKGALRTVIVGPDAQHFAVWNVHLQSGAENVEVRQRQIGELIDWIRATGDEHLFVMGDFNCGPGDDDWELLRRELAAFGLEPRSSRQPTYDHAQNPLAANEPPCTVDHVFVAVAPHARSGPARRIYDLPCRGRFLSDHFGLEVRWQADHAWR